MEIFRIQMPRWVHLARQLCESSNRETATTSENDFSSYTHSVKSVKLRENTLLAATLKYQRGVVRVT